MNSTDNNYRVIMIDLANDENDYITQKCNRASYPTFEFQAYNFSFFFYKKKCDLDQE